jgi:RNA polymerase sigma-70 factor (ECF subfamily)
MNSSWSADDALNWAAPGGTITRAYALIVLTLGGDRISAITWFGDLGLFPHFGLPRTLPA